MTTSIQGKRVAFLATDGVEEVEYTEPRKAVESAGGTAELVSIKDGEIQAVNHMDKAGTYRVEKSVKEADVSDYDALVLPGGVANPDFLRVDNDAIRFVRDFMATGKPVAAICHGPWTLVEAGAVSGRTMTSWPSLRTDLANAGATWVDEEVFVDDHLITSRKPDDLPAFCGELLSAIAKNA
ncbi:type 1 glutamine amidotransferase domain-containing protein [Actinoplanes sp. NPDC048796]|uniref:type 1 glutamine amidotransferase domain-containing protein n=1 Tax=Actinoplanes sp. NPDC048796 TaxID=3155640 RepID=UPI0033D74C69